MGRKRKPEELKKRNITIRLPMYIILKLKDIENYTSIVENLLIKYFENK
jgi:hypothetical protein